MKAFEIGFLQETTKSLMYQSHIKQEYKIKQIHVTLRFNSNESRIELKIEIFEMGITSYYQ